ncbi:hypothetical protein GCM10027062_37270 [Nocardioides hungaricus]
MAPLVMILGGLALAAHNVWQRRGRSSAARAWADPGAGALTRRAVLVVRPLIAVVLVLGALLLLLDKVAAATVVLGLAILAGLLLIGAWTILPLPVPAVLQPGWYRRRSDARVH